MPAPRQRRAISEAHARLGTALRLARVTARLTTRQIPKDGTKFYSSGHISLVEAGAVAASPELVDAYVDAGGDGTELRALHEQALAATRDAGRVRRQGRPAQVATRPPREASAVRDRREVQQHYVVVAQDASYTFSPSRAIRELVCTVRIRAKVSGVCLYHAGFAYPTDQRPGVLAVETISGGALAEVRESPSGAIAVYFRLDHDLDPGDPQPHDLSFRVGVNSDVPAAPRLRYFADAGNEQLSIRVDMSAAGTPGSLWWFAAPDVVDAEHADSRRRLVPHDGGYHRTFERMVPGWCYGFAWTW